ncbi:hypothetical protein EsH8_VI_001085 [Colletotrichum jinshuiense]
MARACDRCCFLKTQCDGVTPCSRCKRVGIPCLRERPARRRGRPPHDIRTVHQSKGTSATSTSNNSFRVSIGVRNSPATQAPEASPCPSPIPPLTSGENDQQNSEPGHPTSLNVVDENLDEDDSYQNGQEEIDGERSLSVAEARGDDPDVITAGLDTPCANLAASFLVFDEITALGLDFEGAQNLLSSLFQQPERLGIFNALSDLPQELSMPSRFDLSGAWPLDLHFMLLAAGLELTEPAQLSSTARENADLLIDTLRIESLKRLPLLAWKSSDLSVSQCLALMIASHTWSLTPDIMDIACRWNSIAGLIWHDLYQQDSLAQSKPEIFDRTGKAIEVQKAVLSLLQYRLPTISKVPHAQDSTQYHESPVSTHWESASASTSTGCDFFSLFTPLIEPLLKVTEGQLDVSALDAVRNSLEVYFLQFPTSLLELRCLRYPYQAEAMIWFHGIFILTYVNRDLFHILTSDSLPSSPEFLAALEHAILVGEVLPYLLQLDPNCNLLSPATCFFVILSSTITSVALRQFLYPLDRAGAQNVNITAPTTLLISAENHLRLLHCLFHTSRFTSSLISSVRDYLSALSESTTTENWAILNSALDELGHYRWCTGGRGVVRLSDVTTEAIRNQGSGACASQPDHAQRLSAIESICSPKARICLPGCFEMSIRLL